MTHAVAAEPGPTLWLSCHVHYACRHSGACCSAGWPLPVEMRAVAGIEAAVATGWLRTVDGEPIWLRETADAPDDIAGTFRLAAGACVFHAPRHPGEAVDAGAAGARSGARHCAVHAVLGQDALPSSCRHFPRVCLIDDRGVRVSLSHYCPTAAAMLVDHEGPVEIVPGPDAVPGTAVPEGLDAREELPPLLTPDVLMDLESLSAWERHVVRTLAGPSAPDGPPERVLHVLQAQAERLREWIPGGAPLTARIDGLSAVGVEGAPQRDGGTEAIDSARRVRSLQLAAGACRAPWTWPDPPEDLDSLDRRLVAPLWMAASPVVRRYLAAKAFGAWISYQADAARGLVAWLQLALDVLRVEAARACGNAGTPLDRDRLLMAVRQADLLLVHYAGPVTSKGLSPP